MQDLGVYMQDFKFTCKILGLGTGYGVRGTGYGVEGEPHADVVAMLLAAIHVLSQDKPATLAAPPLPSFSGALSRWRVELELEAAAATAAAATLPQPQPQPHRCSRRNTAAASTTPPQPQLHCCSCSHTAAAAATPP